MSSTTIQEIQSLRGFAIISVFFFHMWPTAFPNGYLGVDIFFVISGYLMAMLLFKPQPLTVYRIADFYYRRAKRILPLYYIVLPLIFIACYAFIGIAWLDSTHSFAIYSLALLKNMKTIWDDGNYFNAFESDSNTKDAFLHLWSLALEMQFYLFVPFIFLILQKLRSSELKITCLLIICLLSYIHYYNSDPTSSFNNCVSRVWQFGFGMLAFIAEESYTFKSIGKYTLWQFLKSDVLMVTKRLHQFASCVLVFVAVVPILLPSNASCPIITLSCSCILFSQASRTNKVFKYYIKIMLDQILSSKLFTYFGDISYSMYLIHWPVIVLFRQDCSPVSIIAITLIFSTISHYCYENWYRKLSQKKVLLLFVFLFLFNLVAFFTILRCPYIKNAFDNYYYNQGENDLSNLNMKTAPANARDGFKLNVKFMRNPQLNPSAIWNVSSPSINAQFTPYWGIYDYPRGNGNQKIAIMGNSFTVNQMDLIHNEFNNNYSSFKAVSARGVMGFYDVLTAHPKLGMDGRYEASVRTIEDFKPDILFLISRYEKDTLYIPEVMEIKKNIGRLEKVSGKIFIHGVTPLVQLGHLSRLIDAISEGSDLEKFNLDRIAADKDIKMISQLLSDLECTKCQVYDIRERLLNGSHYLTYDPLSNLSFFDNELHFTSTGLEKIRPVYTELIARL